MYKILNARIWQMMCHPKTSFIYWYYYQANKWVLASYQNLIRENEIGTFCCNASEEDCPRNRRDLILLIISLINPLKNPVRGHPGDSYQVFMEMYLNNNLAPSLVAISYFFLEHRGISFTMLTTLCSLDPSVGYNFTSCHIEWRTFSSPSDLMSCWSK